MAEVTWAYDERGYLTAQLPEDLIARVYRINGPCFAGTDPHGFILRLEAEHVSITLADGSHAAWDEEAAKSAALVAADVALAHMRGRRAAKAGELN